MSYMIGADVQELRDLASVFRAKASQLRTMESNLNYRINSAPWHGHDVAKFMHEWNNLHRRKILNVAAQIETAAGTVSANADQQVQASTAGYSGDIYSVDTFRRLEDRSIQSARPRGLDPLLAAGGGILSTVAGVALAEFSFAKKFNDIGSNLLTVADAPRSVMESAERIVARQDLLANLQRWKATLTDDSFANIVKNASKDVNETVEVGGRVSKVMSVAGKVLAPLGTVFSAVDLVSDIQHKDAGMAVVDGAGVVVGVLATAVAFGLIANPVGVAVIGAAGIGLAVAQVVTNKDVQQAAGVATKWAGDTLKSGVNQAAQAASRSVTAATDAIAGASKAAGNFVNIVTNPLKVFGW